MLKNLLIFVLLLGLFAYWHGDDRQPAAGALQSQRPANPTAPAAVEQHSGSNLQQKGPEEQATGEPESVQIILPPKDNYDYILFAVNIVLGAVGIAGVGVGIFGIIYAKNTLGQISIQTTRLGEHAEHFSRLATAAKDNAKAALLNAQAIINAERAWIVVNVETTAPGEYEFSAKNVGKTPAKIAVIYCAKASLHHNESFVPTAEYEKGESLMGAPLGLLPPSASIVIYRYKHVEMRGNRSIEEWQAYFARGFATVLTYGKIAYYDTLEVTSKEPHITKWLYWHLPIDNATPIVDPRRPEYNTYT